MIFKEIIYGGPNIGVYLALNNQYFFYPPRSNVKLAELVKEIDPEIIPIKTFIAGSSIIGSYMALNSNGMVVPGQMADLEIDIIKESVSKSFTITEIDVEPNAFGNLILCNDFGAILSPKLVDVQDIISKALKVPVKILEFAGSDLPGSCGIANNHGVLVHPMIEEENTDIIADMLKVDLDVCTLNMGNPFVGGGAVVNDVGALFGRDSTGPEISRMMDILQLK
jgi:translation initiation factor 6